MEHSLLEAGDRLEPLRADHIPDPAPQRGGRVGSEVVPVVAENAVQQQFHLDSLKLVTLHNCQLSVVSCQLQLTIATCPLFTEVTRWRPQRRYCLPFDP